VFVATATEVKLFADNIPYRPAVLFEEAVGCEEGLARNSSTRKIDRFPHFYEGVYLESTTFMGMIRDMQQIATLAKQKREENERFRVFIKSIPTKQLDRKVFQLSEEITSQIDCTQCANCCKTIEPGVSEGEIERLAAYNRQSTNDFIKEFISQEPGTGIHYLHQQPCIFLQDHKCSIYNGRPASCADYPHLHRPQFKFRFKAVMNQYEICPIVFNVVERLKTELAE
jgi:hypothetical protein